MRQNIKSRIEVDNFKLKSIIEKKTLYIIKLLSSKENVNIPIGLTAMTMLEVDVKVDIITKNRFPFDLSSSFRK